MPDAGDPSHLADELSHRCYRATEAGGAHGGQLALEELNVVSGWNHQKRVALPRRTEARQHLTRTTGVQRPDN